MTRSMKYALDNLRHILSLIKRRRVIAALSFTVPFLLILLLYALLKIVPFGNNTFLFNDMKRQYLDFYSHYRRVLTTDENFLYSFSSGLGGGTLGLFAYYLTSPLLIPFVFVSRHQLPAAISLMLAVKCGLCGLTAFIALSDLCARRPATEKASGKKSGKGAGKAAGKGASKTASGPTPAILLFTTAYAFSSYVVLNLQNAMWIDVVILFPLLFMHTRHFLKGEKSSGVRFILLLFLSLYCNYYITYMILLFLFVYVLLYSENRTSVLRWCCLCAVSAGLSAFLMLPTFLSLIGSGKNSMAYGKGLYFPSLSPRDILSKAFSMSFDTSQIFDGTPLIYCGVMMCFLFTLYFFNSAFSRKEKIKAAVLSLFLVISFSVPVIDIVWHAMSEPEGYRYRYSFILIFLVICCSYQCWLERRSLTKKNILYSFLIVAAVSAIVLTGSYTYLAGLKKLANVTLLLSLALLLYIILAQDFHKGPLAGLLKDFTVLACLSLTVVHLFDLSVNFYITYRANSLLEHQQSFFDEKLATDGALIEEIKAQDGDFYRIENKDPRSENDAMLYWYNGVSVYSSETQMRQRGFLKKLGFNENTFFVAYGPHNTKLVNRLFGVRYLLGDGTYEKDDFAVPVAVGMQESLPVLIQHYEETADESNPFSFAQSVLGMYTGHKAEVFKAPQVLEHHTEDSDTAAVFKLRTAADGMLYFYAVNLKTYEDMILTVNGVTLPDHFGNLACTRVLDLGSFPEGSEVTVEVRNITQMPEAEDFLFVTEDLKKEDAVLGPAAASSCDIEKVTSSHLYIDAPEDAKALLLSVPYSEEWEVRIDGVPAKTQPLFDMYTGIDLPSDGKAHTVELTFVPAGWHAGIVISILFAAGFILYLFLEKTNRLAAVRSQFHERISSAGAK